jgi:hypothetical protein
MLNPAEKNRVIDHDAALAHNLFEVKVADPISAISVHANEDYFHRKATTFEIGHGGLLDDFDLAPRFYPSVSCFVGVALLAAR